MLLTASLLWLRSSSLFLGWSELVAPIFDCPDPELELEPVLSELTPPVLPAAPLLCPPLAPPPVAAPALPPVDLSTAVMASVTPAVEIDQTQ